MVSAAEFNNPGRHNWVTRNLRKATSALTALESGRTPPLLLSNITSQGLFIGEAGETLDRIKKGLLKSERIFRQGNTIVFLGSGADPRRGCSPKSIAIDGTITKTAPAIVANLLMCLELKANSTGKGAKVDQPTEYPVQFAVPSPVLQLVVAADGFPEGLPEARMTFNNPVFDADVVWLEAGYHPGQQILVCGDSFDPAPLPLLAAGLPAPASIQDVIDRLPPLIGRMVAGFHWHTPVDLINFIGSALQIVLMPMLVDDGHPGVMIWGNQPGIGKSLLAQILSILKDGDVASPTSLDGGAREVENQIASELNDGRTVVFIDNQKGSLNVPVLEASMTAKAVAIRVFHTQTKLRRLNALLWIITTNDSLPSDDMLSRCVHVRLRYEGVPETHRFAMTESDLLAFVQNNRQAILAELAGMVYRWLDAGRPMNPAPCRFAVFGRVIGSVLAANGLPGFLSNSRGEVREHSAKHLQLEAVAARVIDGRNKGFIWEVDCPIDQADDEFKKLPPPASPMEQKDWVHVLHGEGVIPANCSTAQQQKTAATQFLNSVVNTPIEVDVGDQTVQAVVVSRPLRGRRTAYALAVGGLPTDPTATPTAGEPSTTEAPEIVPEPIARLIAPEGAEPLFRAEEPDTSPQAPEDGNGLWD